MGLTREGECHSCGECCKTLRIVTPLARLLSQHGSVEEANAYYSYRGGSITGVSTEEDLVSVEFPIPCDKLTPENHCLLHATPEIKPVICHRYPMAPDDIDECGYRWVRIPR